MRVLVIASRTTPITSTQLERLTAIEELRALKARFCRLADAKRWAEFGRLFTSTAQARFYGADGRLTFLADSPDIGTVIGGRVGAARTVHHTFGHELTIVSATRAEGLWGMEDIVVDDGAGVPFRRVHGFGHYHETYERHDGRWLIRSLELTRVHVELT